jgi:hypothetical protein
VSASVYIPVAIIPAGKIVASENARRWCRWQNGKARIGGASEYGPEGEARLRSQASPSVERIGVKAPLFTMWELVPSLTN